jgi:hypothetical protein
MSTFDTAQPIDDQALYQLLNSIIIFEKEPSASIDYLKFLQGQVAIEPWNNRAREKLDSLKRELLERENRNKQNLVILQKYADDSRVRVYITQQLSEGDWQKRIEIVRLLARLGTDWAVETLREISYRDAFQSEKSTAPDSYTDPDMVAMFPYESTWPVREKASEALKQLGKQ